jgi:hypothetical protein
MDESVSFQNHRRTWCRLQMYSPMLNVLLLVGHIEIIAWFQNCISESVGCSFGHLMFDHASPCSLRERMSELTFPPDRVSTLDKKST